MEQPVVNLGDHPLQNQVILKLIFNLLESSATLQDWKNIRLVCKLWHSQTLTRWRNHAVLELVDETGTRFFDRPPSQKLTPYSLLIHWQNPKDSYKLKEKPYLNYKLQNQIINLPFIKSSLTASLFWSTVGPWMKSLILKQVNFYETSDEEPWKLLQFLIDKTPNLEQVTFDNLFWDGFVIPEALALNTSLKCTSVVNLTCKESFGFHLSCFPNLQRVRLDAAQPIEFSNLIFPQFPRISAKNPVQNSKVTHLDMINCIVGYKRDRRQTFRNIKFPSLEHLSLNLNYPPEQTFPEDGKDNEFGQIMMANHRKTLKELRIFCWIPSGRFISSAMPELSKLFIWGNCIDNLDFLKFTPNLTLLHVDLYGLEKQEEMRKLVEKGEFDEVTQRLYIPTYDEVEDSVLSGKLAGVVLQKLEYFQMNGTIWPESVRALREWMPNLRIFKSVLDSSNLPIVCELWPNLEQLHCLFQSEIMDKDVIESGLVGLKYLKSFHYNTACDQSSLSNKSARKGFLKMEELTDLQICVSKDFSRKYEDKLISRIQNVKVYRNYTENENHKDWKCCRDDKYLEYISNYEHPELYDIFPDASYNDSDVEVESESDHNSGSDVVALSNN